MELSQVLSDLAFDAFEKRGVVQKPTNPESLTLEAWSSGYLAGALIIMGCITIANMRKSVLLHKLILLELSLAIWRAFWLFLPSPIYSWWLSASGMLLDASWTLHNVIAWMKVRPFLSRRASQAFIWTLALSQPFWIMEVYANFAYFHGGSDLFLRTRPWEALFRDPWWIFASSVLLWKIKRPYEMTLMQIISISPRFGIMMLAAVLSVVFFVLDIVSATNTLNLGLPSGINPFWKISTVFKCLMDCVILDDFKTAVERLRAYKISRIGSFSQDASAHQTPANDDLARSWEQAEAQTHGSSKATTFEGGFLVEESDRTGGGPSVRDLEHVYPSQAHVPRPSSLDSDLSSPRDGAFGDIFCLEDVPSPLDKGLRRGWNPRT